MAHRATPPPPPPAPPRHPPPPGSRGGSPHIAPSSSRALSLATRPRYGSVGQRVQVQANFFPLTLQPTLTIAQYAVNIWRKKRLQSAGEGDNPTAKTPPANLQGFEDVAVSALVEYNKQVMKQVEDRFRAHMGAFVYDGRSIGFCARRLASELVGEQVKVEVGRNGLPPTDLERQKNKAEPVYVVIEFAKAISYDQLLSGNVSAAHATEYMTALDLALASLPSHQYVQVGRSFYAESSAREIGRRGEPSPVSAWTGFYQSVRMGEKRLLLNFDESTTVFWNYGGKSLMDMIASLNRGNPLYPDQQRAAVDIANSLKGLKIRATHTGITYRMHGFARHNADTYSFEDREGNMTSVTNYFESNYNIRLRFPRLALIKVHPTRSNLIPPELLMILPNQRVSGLLTSDQTASIVKIASTRPDRRRSNALNTMRRLNPNQSNACRDFGITVGRDLVKVEARVLPPPSIRYANSGVRPSNGQWRTRDKMCLAMPIQNWVVINSARLNRNALDKFLRNLCIAGSKSGMRIQQRPNVVECRPGQIVSTMRGIWNDSRGRQPQLQLMLIIKERRDTAEYNAIKSYADTQMAIPTQVMLAKFVSKDKGQEMYCANLILKINSKMGGINNKVEYEAGKLPNRVCRRPYIVLGADVTHPAGGGRGPSVAALVGSRDMFATQFSSSLRCQQGRQEIIEELGEMFVEIYGPWRKQFGQKFHAEVIIMFRDGVSEGQFEQVMQVEVEALRKAYKKLNPNGPPAKITYIIVTKRHHTRFFPMGNSNADRSGNILPGTVVDRDITSDEFFDFYLNSHAGIQGTNKPSKYTVLVDENEFTSDELQQYVYLLSHGFVRCNRSVSMVNSAYYAHLLAFRGRAYLGEDMSSDGGSSSMASQGSLPEFKVPESMRKMLYFV